MPCPYANLLGVPGQGVHATRIFGFALVDTLLTILLAISTAWLTNTSIIGNFVFWFVVGEVLHYAAGTQTAFLTMIGIHTNCNN
jgi:pheromone shutdown protein TraB